MSFRIRAVLCITFHRLIQAYLLFGSQHNGRKLHSTFPQQCKCLIRHGSGDRLCGQIKDFRYQPGCKCLNGRKHRCHRFPDSGWSLYKQSALSFDRLIHTGSHLFLSFPVFIWEFQFCDRCISASCMGYSMINPFHHLIHCIMKPFLKK